MTLIKLTQWDNGGKQIPIYINVDNIDWIEPHNTRLKASIHFGGSVLHVMETAEEVKAKIAELQFSPWPAVWGLEDKPENKEDE